VTDRELRALRDAHRDDELLGDFCNRIIRYRRNLAKETDQAKRAIIQGAIDRLEARIVS